MAEAHPSKKGGHAYGRRTGNLSNTSEPGELCIYIGHGVTKFSDSSYRYDSHQACTRCVAAAREGRISFDLNRMLKKEKKRALKFWSQVDIRNLDECWNWTGCINNRTSQPQFAWRRHRISTSTQHHPQRVAMWYTWGDLGFTGVKTTCGNKYCCNPLHLIPQNVGVFVDHDSYVDSFELACELHTLRMEVQEFQIERAMELQSKEEITEEMILERSDLLFNPEVQYEERFAAVITDFFEGRNASQFKPDIPGSLDKPTHNDDDDLEPHEYY